MIEEIRIKNYLSFHEEQVLSFVASKKKSNKFDEYYCIAPDQAKPDHKLLRMILLYGANASGKSNTLQALQLIRQIIGRTEYKKKPNFYKPFLGASETIDAPVSIGITFWLSNRKFIYNTELKDDYIVSEEFIHFPNGKKSRIFRRTYDPRKRISNLKFSNNLEINISAIEQEAISTYLIPSISVFAAASKVNQKNQLLREVFEYFQGFIRPILPSHFRLSPSNDNLSQLLKNEMFIDFIKKADFNIQELSLEKESIDVNDVDFISDGIIQKRNGIVNRQVFKVTHTNKNRSFDLSLDDESLGTNKWLVLSFLFFMILSREQFSLIDEIESSLHYDLVNHFLVTFLKNNISKSQIIATTHNINLLNADFIRRDAVWFTERKEDGSTELFCADDFGLHKNLSLFNAYRTGKLGAVPFVEPFWMEQNEE